MTRQVKNKEKIKKTGLLKQTSKRFEKELNKLPSFILPVLNKLRTRLYHYASRLSNNVFYIDANNAEVFEGIGVYAHQLCQMCRKLEFNEPAISGICIRGLYPNDFKVSFSGLSFIKNLETNYEPILSTYGKKGFLFKDKYSLYAYSERSKSGYEVSMNDIAKACFTNVALYEFFKLYFAMLAEDNYLVKDILADFERDPLSLSFPLKFSSLQSSYSKKNLFETKYPQKSFSKRFNKDTLQISYLFLNIKKYIPAKSFEEVYNTVVDNDLLPRVAFNYRRKEQCAKDILSTYLTYKLGCSAKNLLSDEDEIYIRDYVSMCFTLKLPINLDIRSLARIRQEHDTMAIELRVRTEFPPVVMKPNNPFLPIALPDEIVMLKTTEELVEEGIANRNCVASYVNAINHEECAICSLRYKGSKSRYTIEIVKKPNGLFHLAQIKGFANSTPRKDVIEFVQSVIKENNDNIIKKKIS